jgi:hypothetical protein
MCPSTLQEAKPKAGSSRRRGDGGTDRRRESKPRSRSRIVRTIDRSFGSTHICCRVSNRAAGHPDENQSGRADGTARTTRGPGRTEMPRPPGCGIKPAKGERTPGAPPDEATSSREGPARPARPRDCPGMRVAERRAKRTRRRMTRPGGEIEAACDREARSAGPPRACGTQMRRVGFTDRTRATDRRRRCPRVDTVLFVQSRRAIDADELRNRRTGPERVHRIERRAAYMTSPNSGKPQGRTVRRS